MTKKIWAIEDIKVYYMKAITDLSFKKLRAFILEMQKLGNKYGDHTSEQYYLLLTKVFLYDKFMKTFLETIYEKKD